LNIRTIAKGLTWLLLALISYPSQAAVTLDEAGRLGVYGDFRGRVESDWDSKQSDGTDRDDRTRIRTRLRLGMDYRASDQITLGFRIRSGSDDSQQSPHVTVLDLDNNDTGDAHFNFDKWYFKYSSGNVSTWLGRNSLPLWKPDELLWDDDVTPAGLGLTYKSGGLSVNAGYFSNPAGMKNFTGNTGLVQVVFESKIRNIDLLFAGGLITIDGDQNNVNNTLLQDNNGVRDYQLWIGNIQAGMKAFEKPLKLNLNLYHNSQDYSASDPDAFTAFHRDETHGYVVSAGLGDTKERGDWLVGYYYVHIETFAVNNSYAQDDWMRWGSATQTRPSNFEGSEFRAVWGLGGNMNLLARLYIVEGIKLRTTTSVTKEDGNRFRIDFNWKF